MNFITNGARRVIDPANVAALAMSQGVDTGVGHALFGDIIRGLIHGVKSLFGGSNSGFIQQIPQVVQSFRP